LLRAVHTVIEAAALYHDNRLGMTPTEYFSQRGFGYAAQPGPHLKVDDSTHPDQCLRIYWDDDAEVASHPWCKRATGVGSFKSSKPRRRTYTRGTTSIAQ